MKASASGISLRLSLKLSLDSGIGLHAQGLPAQATVWMKDGI